MNTIRSNPPAITRRKAFGFALVAVIIGLTAALVPGEILLRAFGFPPLQPFKDDGRPFLYEPDRVLGWRTKPGSYVIENYTPGGPPVQVTILADGRRATGPEARPGRPIVAVMGCSFTFGAGLSDSETYSSRLQVRNPEVEVRNYGAGGYGTYQSLLKLEQVFMGPERPALVLYGFNAHHVIRNVAEPSYLRVLRRSGGGRGFMDLPYCSLGPDGSLCRNPPTHYPDFLPSKYSAIANALQICYMKLTSRPRTAKRQTVTERLLEEMDGLCRRNGAQFAVILLTPSL